MGAARYGFSGGRSLKAKYVLFGVYGVLMVADVFLLQRFAKEGPVEETAASAGSSPGSIPSTRMSRGTRLSTWSAATTRATRARR